MPNPTPEALRGASDARTRVLGPYETAYDVRHGYEGADPAAPGFHLVSRAAAPDPVYIGRRRER
ncbi:MAG TPA: hypothetical protein VF615_07790 [Longimicrobiaceae bacterium]|jgi:hypothetical protein